MTSIRQIYYVGIVLLGCAISFVSAVSSQAAVGYFLNFGVVLMGIVPYLIYAMAVYIRRGAGFVSLLIGPLLIAAQLWMVYTYHFVNQDSGTLLYFGPPVLGVVILPLLIVAMRNGYTEARMFS